jgi:hypothetical protein
MQEYDRVSIALVDVCHFCVEYGQSFHLVWKISADGGAQWPCRIAVWHECPRHLEWAAAR